MHLLSKSGFDSRWKQFRRTATALGLALIGSSSWVSQADTTPTTTASPTSPTDSLFPSTLGGAGAADPNTTLGNQYGSCGSTTNIDDYKSKILTALGRNADGTAKKGGASPSGTPSGGICTPPDDASFPEIPDSCSSILPPPGATTTKTSSKGMTAIKDQLNALLAQAKCADTLAKSLQKELGCLQTKMQAAEAAMAAEAKNFNAYRNLAVTEVQSGDNYLRELKAQEAQLDAWLNGDGKANPGLKAVQQALGDLDTNVDAQINGPVSGDLSNMQGGIKPLFDKVQQLRDDFEKTIPEYESGLSRNCIETNLSSKYVCHIGDGATKLTDFVQCAMTESLRAGNSGGDPNAADANQTANANVRSKRFADSLSGLLGDFKTNRDFPQKGIGDGGDSDPWDADPGTILDSTSASLARRFSDLESLDQMSDRERAAWQSATGTESPAALVESVTKSCMIQAHNQVAKERAAKSGKLASAEASVTRAEDAVRVKARSLLNAYDLSLSNAAKAMQFTYVAPNLKGCGNAAPDDVVTCLRQGQAAIHEMFRGGQGTAKNWVLPDPSTGHQTDPALVQRFPQLLASVKCAGVDECVSKIGTESARRAEMNKSGAQQRITFIQSQNTALDNMIAGTAASYNQSVAGLSAEIEKMNSALGALELDKMKPDLYTECPAPEYDSAQDMTPAEELMKQPKDFVAAIGCRTSPPLKLNGGSTFDTASKSLGSITTKSVTAQNKLNALLLKLNQKYDDCKEKAKTDFLDSLSDLGSCWGTNVCGASGGPVDSARASVDMVDKAYGLATTGGSAGDVSTSTGFSADYCKQVPSAAKLTGDRDRYCTYKNASAPEEGFKVKANADLYKALGLTDQGCDDPKMTAATGDDVTTTTTKQRRYDKCIQDVKDAQKVCTDDDKALLDLVNTNQTNCGKKFRGAVGKAGQVNVIDWNVDGTAKTGE